MSLDHPADFVKRQTTSADAFLGGRLRLAQPEQGFRAGLDSVLLGASVEPGAGHLLDLGAGVGTAALVALAQDNELAATLVDSDPAAVALADHNIAENRFASRAHAFLADVSRPLQLTRDYFGAVIANPPYFSGGTVPAATRQAARHMPEADLDRWARTAATHAAPGGSLAMIHVPAVLPKLLAAFEGRFGAITILPLSPRAGEPTHRVLVRGIKGSRAPLTLLATRAVHGEGRKFTPEFDAIFRGEARLHW